MWPAPYAEDRVGASHNVDPSTSREAAELNYPKSGSQRETVLKALAARGDRGATFQELQDLTGVESAAKRLTELKRDGWATPKVVPGEYGNDVDARRSTRSGASAVVYVATLQARRVLEAERAPRKAAGGGASSSSEDRVVRDHEPPSAQVAAPSALTDKSACEDKGVVLPPDRDPSPGNAAQAVAASPADQEPVSLFDGESEGRVEGSGSAYDVWEAA